MPIRDVIIVGAGPSGIFSALHLPSDLNILLLEKAEKPAQKLLMSAKGRGNLTNIHLSAQEYVSDDSHFVQQALSHYGPQDFLSFLNQHMIAYHKEDNGRILLASGKVAQFHDFLLSQLSDRRIEIAYRQSLLNLRKEKGIFLIETTTDHFQAKNVILATGSKSIPALGSSDIALQIAKKYALSSTDFYPALVGFETTKNLSALSGSSVIANGELYLHNKLVYQQTGPILFTHWGLSGPVVFNASLHLNEAITKDAATFKFHIKKADITKRFLAYLGFSSNKFSTYTFTTAITKPRGFEESKVCGGGIHTSNLTSNFELKTVSGLYIIGECLNVTGKTGGYNLQRCRTSAYCCAKSFFNSLPSGKSRFFDGKGGNIND